ncbi:MAG: hypothetical protein IJ944_06560 [Clostridia bacterium]|nr:hypothetical protein [Clostridia bacterium]
MLRIIAPTTPSLDFKIPHIFYFVKKKPKYLVRNKNIEYEIRKILTHQMVNEDSLVAGVNNGLKYYSFKSVA